MTICTDIPLSKQTQDLIQTIQDLGLFNIGCKDHASSMNLNAVVTVLNQCINHTEKIPKNTRFQLVSLRTALLTDLYAALNNQHGADNHAKKSSRSAWLKFIVLIGAGILVVGCQGFDALTSLLGVLPLPAGVIFLAGFAFSILSVALFCSINSVQIAEDLGITLKDVPYLLNIYLTQKKQINAIRKALDTHCFTTCSLEDLKTMELLLAGLQQQFKSLKQESGQFKSALSGYFVRFTQFIYSCMSGVLFFGGGYFAAQSVAVVFLSLFLGSVSPVFWPVVAFSTLVGTAALAFYWHVELPGMNKVISSWFGLDEEKIEQLCDEDVQNKEEAKLNNLMDKVKSAYQLRSQVKVVRQFDLAEDESIIYLGKTGQFTLSNNRSGFYYKQKSEKNDLLSTLPRTKSCDSFF